METFEEMKQQWERGQTAAHTSPSYNSTALHQIMRTRTNKQLNRAFQYFWAAFVLQMIVYGLLAHVVIRYWGDWNVVLLATAGIALYIPFTIVIMRKYKQMAIARMGDDSMLRGHVQQQYKRLQAIFTFKKRYELILIPLSCALGAVLTFQVFVPGGASGHVQGTIVTAVIALASCAWAIWRENKRNFALPLQELAKVLKEFDEPRTSQ